jgi:hypothetical protein
VASARALLLALVLVAVPAVGAFRAPGAPMEEGKLLIASEQVLRGAIPHVDFEHLYAPGDVWAVAASFVAFGRDIDSERAVGMAYLVALVVGVFLLARRRMGPWGSAGCAALGGLLIVPFGVHAYSWVGGLGFAACGVGVALLARDRPRFVLLAGFLSGLALLLRADLVPAVAVPALVLAGSFSWRQRLLWLAGGAVAPIGFLVHVARAGLGPVWEGMVVDPVVRLRPGRELPMPPPDELTSWFDTIAADPVPAVQVQLLFWATVAAVVALVVAAVIRRNRADLAVGLFVLAVAPQMLQRSDTVHVRFLACVAVALVPTVVRWAIAVPLVAMAAAALAPHIVVDGVVDKVELVTGDVEVVTNAGRWFPVSASEPDAERTVDEVERLTRGRPRAGLFVGPRDLRRTNYSDAYLYHLLPRLRPASYFLEMNPGTTNAAGSRLARDLRRADVLVLSDNYDMWVEPNESRRPGPRAPMDVVARHFCETAHFGPYRVYRRC